MIPIIYSDEFLQHDTGQAHPECAERLTAIVDSLRQVSWQDRLDWRSPTPVTHRNVLAQVQKIHAAEYIQRVQQIAKGGGGYLDPDTVISSHSYQAALLAVSAWLDGVDLVLENSRPAFVLARPPGHHALADRGMGFCVFANAAIAATYALEQHNIDRVAILDWDVHHGNGTEALVENNRQIIYCSLHQSPCYPGTGEASFKGKQQNIFNIPMKPGSTISEYEPIFIEEVIPYLQQFEPNIIIVSAGYDANHQDPLASISLQPNDYGLLTKHLLKVSTRLLFGLEGGYDLSTLASSVVATLASCL